jgi:phosphate starvation-inducible membrane PsiE
MAQDTEPPNWQTIADSGFRHLEHAGYLVLGILLAVAAVLALIDAAGLLAHAVIDLGGVDVIVDAVDRLLFVFMLIEILHTVRASLSSGGLTCEPFLVVGLIASIRRVLVITLETSQITKSQGWTPQTEAILHASMVELGVMAVLILAMVFSIYLLHRAQPETEGPVGSSV